MIVPFSLLVVLQCVDVFVHVATGQVEPVRIAASLFLVAGAAAAWRHSARSTALMAVAGLVYLALNTLFLAENGMVNPATETVRAPLFVFVIGSLLLAGWLHWRLKERSTL